MNNVFHLLGSSLSPSPPLSLSISLSSMKHQELSLLRSKSTTITARSNSTQIRSYSSITYEFESGYSLSDNPIVQKHDSRLSEKLSSLFQPLINLVCMPSLIPTFKWLSIPRKLPIIRKPSNGRRVTGTFFGHRHGHVTYAVQMDPLSEPILLLELAMSTATLVREMSTGLIRIALECEKLGGSAGREISRQGGPKKLLQESQWTMYCKGRKCGFAVSRTCSGSDKHVLNTLQSVSAGAGVIPGLEDGRKSPVSEGELLFMRAKYERVVGGKDSEAFYMMNPDGCYGGPELSIFLLRI